MSDVERYDQFIDGEFVPSESDDRAEVTFPYDGESWASVPLGTTGDVDCAVADAIEAGTIWINEYRTLTYNSPFGGYKDSGLGRENGHEGLEEYLQTKSVWVDLAGEVEDPFKLG